MRAHHAEPEKKFGNSAKQHVKATYRLVNGGSALGHVGSGQLRAGLPPAATVQCQPAVVLTHLVNTKKPPLQALAGSRIPYTLRAACTECQGKPPRDCAQDSHQATLTAFARPMYAHA